MESSLTIEVEGVRDRVDIEARPDKLAEACDLAREIGAHRDAR